MRRRFVALLLSVMMILSLAPTAALAEETDEPVIEASETEPIEPAEEPAENPVEQPAEEPVELPD